MVYKSLNGLVPMYLSNIFSRNSNRGSVYLRNSESDLIIIIIIIIKLCTVGCTVATS